VTISDAEPSNSIELAAEIVAAFVANNSLPTVELPALIHSVHAAWRDSQAAGEYSPLVEKQEPAVSVRKSLTPDFLVCSGRRQEIQVATTTLADTRHDAGSIPREMEPAARLSDGRAQLRGGAIGDGQADRTWADAEECRGGQARTTGEGKLVNVDPSVSGNLFNPWRVPLAKPKVSKVKVSKSKISKPKRRRFAGQETFTKSALINLIAEQNDIRARPP